MRLCDEPVTNAVLAEEILLYVLRTRESIVLDDASTGPFAADPYIRQRRVHSVLCLPLINQAKLVGVLLPRKQLGCAGFRTEADAGLEVARVSGGDLAREYPLVP